MVAVLLFFWQRLFVYEIIENDFELGGGAAFLLEHTLVVFFELTAHIDVKH